MTPLPSNHRQPTLQEVNLARLFERIRGVHAEVKDIDMQIAGVRMAPKKHQTIRLKWLLDHRAAKEFEFKTLHRQYKYGSAGKWRRLYLAITYRLSPLNP